MEWVQKPRRKRNRSLDPQLLRHEVDGRGSGAGAGADASAGGGGGGGGEYAGRRGWTVDREEDLDLVDSFGYGASVDGPATPHRVDELFRRGSPARERRASLTVEPADPLPAANGRAHDEWRRDQAHPWPPPASGRSSQQGGGRGPGQLGGEHTPGRGGVRGGGGGGTRGSGGGRPPLHGTSVQRRPARANRERFHSSDQVSWLFEIEEPDEYVGRRTY